MKRLALLGASIVGTLILAEVLYRVVLAPVLSPATHPAYVEYDSDLGWRYVPGAASRHATDEFDVAIEINAQGFRGADWRPKRAGVSRILLLGDSEAFGWGVEEAQTFARLVERERPDVEILNAGVAAYGTDQELVLLERLLPGVDPDVVVCLFHRNDLFESSGKSSYGRPKPWFELRGEHVERRGHPVPHPVLDRVSLLARAIRKNLWLLRHRRAERDPSQEWAMVEALYRTMRDRLDGRPLVLISDADELQRLAMEEPNIVHVDTRPFLDSAASPVRFPVDGHLNDEGHRLVAQALLMGFDELDTGP